LQLLQATNEIPANLDVFAAYVGGPLSQEAVDDAYLLGLRLPLKRRGDLPPHVLGF
jgi:hypothetical protein